MPESIEMAAFRTRVESALTNIADDIKRLAAASGSMSDEDKVALSDLATKIEAVAAITPEP